MIDEPNPEADEAHDILRRQRDPIARAIAKEREFMALTAQKAAMFDDLFAVAAYWCPNGEPLRDQVDLPSVMHNQQWWKAQEVFARARAIK